MVIAGIILWLVIGFFGSVYLFTLKDDVYLDELFYLFVGTVLGPMVFIIPLFDYFENKPKSKIILFKKRK